jgi:hypothetical protein
MKFALYILPVLLTFSAIPAAADTLTDLLPPDTKVVLGIRVRNLAISSVAQTFAAQAQTAAGVWLKAVPLDGIDFLRDIDEVLIASPGKGPTPPAIVVVTGRFDVARLAAGAKRYRGVPLLTGEKETDSVVALLDDGMGLIGDPALVRAAIDQRGGKGRIDSALNDRITSLRQRYDIWGLGELPAGFVPPMPEAKMLESTLESIDRFQFGMQLASGLELVAEIHPRSPADAEKLNAAFGVMAAMLKGQAPSATGAKFDVQVSGGTLKLAVSIPDRELKQAVAAETAGLSPVSTQTAAQASAPATAEAPETGPAAVPEVPPATTPATLVAPQAAPKPAAPKASDHETDTVILTLPGKK